MSKECGHCGFAGGLQHKGNVTAASGTQQIEAFGEISWNRIWSLSYCPNCERPTLEELMWSDELSDPDVDARRLFPAPADNSVLPSSVQRQLNAALRVKMVEPGLYAVGVRRLLEAVCSEEKASGNALFKQIEDLVQRGRLPDVFARMATQLRRLGNLGAHFTEAEIAADDVAIIEELAEAILEYLYRAPAKLASAEEAIQKRFP